MSKQASPIHSEIYSAVQNRIRSGEYSPGEKLSENLLAAEYNCSRMPVREALKHLEQDGLVTIQPKSGTYVRGYTQEEIRNAVEIRAYLEALAFALSIERDVDTAPMEEQLDRMAACIDGEPFDLVSFGESHMKFHEAMVQVAGNPFLLELYSKLHLNALQKIFFNPMSRRELALTHEEHRRILQLIKDKNPEGERFIKMHLWRQRER